MAFGRTVAEPDQPLGGMPQVIAHLFFGARRDLGQSRVAAGRQGFEQQQVVGIEKHLANDGIAEMPVGLFDDQQVPEFVLRTRKCEVVFASPGTLMLGGVAVKHARLADVVEREIRVRQLLLEFRTRSNQLDHALSQHQGGVTQAQHVSAQCVLGRHRFSTSSGIS